MKNTVTVQRQEPWERTGRSWSDCPRRRSRRCRPRTYSCCICPDTGDRSRRCSGYAWCPTTSRDKLYTQPNVIIWSCSTLLFALHAAV